MLYNTHTMKLGEIIQLSTSERTRDYQTAILTGTNKIHTMTTIKGHRKVAPGLFFSTAAQNRRVNHATHIFRAAPVVHEPVVHEPVVHEPVVHEPVVHEQVVHEPVVHDPVVHEPVVHEPVVHEPVVHEPVVHETTVNEVVHEPDVHEPVVHEPAVHEPAVHEPASDDAPEPIMLEITETTSE
jgi:hypothetical protein